MYHDLYFVLYCIGADMTEYGSLDLYRCIARARAISHIPGGGVESTGLLPGSCRYLARGSVAT